MERLLQDISAENSIDSPELLDPEEFRRQGHTMIDFIADYYRNVEKYPVLSQVSPGYLRGRLPESVPTNSESLDAILRDVRDHILPGLTHWQSPNFFAYFNSCTSVPSILGEMLTAAFNVVGFSWVVSPAATELEMIVMDWMAKLLSLPRCFLFQGGGGGVLHGTTCEALLCTLTAARDKALGTVGRDRLCDLVVYCSDQTHCSLKKSAQIAGVRPDNVRILPTSSSDAFALSPDALRAAIAADVAAGRVPLYLCATVGTTPSTAVDPIRGLSAVAVEHGVWVHVDAAYAGSACICPEFQHFLDGIEAVDSFSFNAHKWLFTAMDCCCLWLKRPQHLVEALATNPEYLRNEPTESKKVVDYKDWQLGLSRRFRALKLWMVLRSYGAAKLRGFVRNHVRLAELFEELVRKDERFVLAAPRTFALVCFRMLPPAGISRRRGLKEANEFNRRLLAAVNSTGKVYMSHAVLGGAYIIRAAVGGSLSEDRHVREAWAVVQEQAAALTSAVDGRG